MLPACRGVQNQMYYVHKTFVGSKSWTKDSEISLLGHFQDKPFCLMGCVFGLSFVGRFVLSFIRGEKALMNACSFLVTAQLHASACS